MNNRKRLEGYADRILKHAEVPANYNAGWALITECYTRDSLVELLEGDTEEDVELMRSAFPDWQREEPAPSYREALRRIQRLVRAMDSNRKEIESSVF